MTSMVHRDTILLGRLYVTIQCTEDHSAVGQLSVHGFGIWIWIWDRISCRVPFHKIELSFREVSAVFVNLLLSE